MSGLFPTYNRFNLSVQSAEGTAVQGEDGKTYLDFGSGIGVCNLGHRHPQVMAAVEEQLQQYWHVSNLYHQPIQQEVAQWLTDHSKLERVFFCNSGAEANEAAIKLARKATGKSKIISFHQSFHGRTFGSMAATGQEKIHAGFGPMLESFEYAIYNDLKSVVSCVDHHTAAIMIELVQGEGGVIPAEQAFITAIEKLCQENDLLLIIDEVQTGIGRTGTKFAFQQYDVSPDIITLAKGLGNGFPVGAMLAKEQLAEAFGPGSHGTTFGGNPLAMAAAKAVLQHVFQADFLEEVNVKGKYLKACLEEKLGQHYQVRGQGLMIGIVSDADISSMVPELMTKGLLVLSAGPHVIRLLPPLTVSTDEIDIAIQLLTEVLLQQTALTVQK